MARSPYLAGRFPHGLAKKADLLALGISSSTITRRCRPGGPWATVLLGQVRLRNGRLTVAERRYAALVHSGQGAMFTGLTGSEMHGVRALPPDPRIHTLIPAERHVASRDFAVVTRTGRLPEPIEIDGYPVAPIARCIVDAATRMDDVDIVRALMADAVQRELCSVEALRAELAEPRRPGTGLARAVFAEIDDGIRSTAEAWARDLVRRAGLPEPRWNVALTRSDGRFVGVVDAYWEEVGLAAEIQSSTFHLSPAALARDTEKSADLAAAGVHLVPIMAAGLRTSVPESVRRLREAYDHAAAAPPPDVVATLYRPV